MFCTVFIRPWLEYRTLSILLLSHGAYCLNRVCTRKTFNLSRLASSITIFFTLFQVGFLNLLFGPPTLTFLWQQLEAWNFEQGIFNTIGFEWRKYIRCDNHGLKRTHNHRLKPGLHFFYSQNVNRLNKHLHV